MREEGRRRDGDGGKVEAGRLWEWRRRVRGLDANGRRWGRRHGNVAENVGGEAEGEAGAVEIEMSCGWALVSTSLMLSRSRKDTFSFSGKLDSSVDCQ